MAHRSGPAYGRWMVSSLIGLLLLAAAPDVTGDWVTGDGSAMVRIGRCGATVCGRVLRVLARNAPDRDLRNRDPALRSRPLIGVHVLTGFGAGGSGEGRAYDPKSGRTYRARLRLNPDGTLRVTGCVAFICRSQTWRRP